MSDALAGAPEDLSVRGVLDRVTSKRAEDVRGALARLVDEGFVTVQNGARGAHLHHLDRPFEGDPE